MVHGNIVTVMDYRLLTIKQYQMIKPTLYIGIDPGVNTGVALWYPNLKKLEVLQFKSHCQAMLFLYDKLRPFDSRLIMFRIEDARKAKPRPDLALVNAGKEQGVGYVKAYSKDWEQFCLHLDYGYEVLAPQNTKVNEQYFECLTGIRTLKTQTHLRDAGMLVFGR